MKYCLVTSGVAGNFLQLNGICRALFGGLFWRHGPRSAEGERAFLFHSSG